MSPSGNHLYAEVVLNEGAESYSFEGNLNGEKRMRDLAKVNVFIGANNSGKSRLMRVLAGTQRINVWPNVRILGENWSLEEVVLTLQKAKTEVLGILEEEKCPDVNGVRELLNKFPVGRCLEEGSQRLSECFSGIEQAARMPMPSSWSGSWNPSSVVPKLKLALAKASSHLPALSNPRLSIPVTKKLYIPTLRSLRDLGGDDTFSSRTKQDYFPKVEHIQVFTGRSLYHDIEKLVRGDLSQRETLRRFETWVGETFFRGETVAIIPRMGQSTLTIKIGDEQEQPIHNLGDGIQAILILAFPLFEREHDHLLAFIEEPELFLHPWLQRVLLEMLSRRFPLHQYFLTTHSNHFLDLTLDVDSVSVFTFEKQLVEHESRERPSRYNVTNVSRSDRRPLELLGVRNSSVLLTNCTIWVEGITDRRYIAHWLDLYQQMLHGHASPDRAKFLKEDLHYSFVEYSGGNITHWSFLDDCGPDVERLCGKLFLIADNDGASPESEKGKRHAKLTEKLKGRFYLLPVREIENMLTPEALSAVLKAYGEVDSNLYTPTQDEYATELLGKFVEEKIIKTRAEKKRKASYAGDSGTLNRKGDFCERAIAAMNGFDSLSLKAQELTKKVYDFIKAAQKS